MRGRRDARPFAFALATAFVAFAALAGPGRAQAPGVPIFDDAAILDSITKQASQLRADGKLLAVATLAAQREAHKRCRLELPAPRREKLAPSAICALAHASTWVVGSLYHCSECSDWHFSGATGYVVAADGAVATCAHVVAPDPDSKDEFLAAAGPDGVVHPVLEVLAADLRTDTCIVRVDAKSLTPLALNVDSRPGDAVFCYGHPQHHFGFFAQGEIARFAVETALPTDADDAEKKDDPKQAPAAEGPPLVVMEITAEFAAGSSGSPVLDEFANVVGHATATEAVFWDDSDPSATNHQMTLRIVTVARDVLALIEPIPPPAPPKAPEPKKAGDQR